MYVEAGRIYCLTTNHIGLCSLKMAFELCGCSPFESREKLLSSYLKVIGTFRQVSLLETLVKITCVGTGVVRIIGEKRVDEGSYVAVFCVESPHLANRFQHNLPRLLSKRNENLVEINYVVPHRAIAIATHHEFYVPAIEPSPPMQAREHLRDPFDHFTDWHQCVGLRS